jgi:hypothetical protein
MRFVGTIERFAKVDVSGLDISRDESGRPIAEALTERFYPGCSVSGVGFFVMEPGQVHPAHRDEQPPYWVTRVHVPVTTNDGVIYTMDDGEHRMEVGKAYRMNTLATHAVANHGETNRIHLVFDIRTA